MRIRYIIVKKKTRDRITIYYIINGSLFVYVINIITQWVQIFESAIMFKMVKNVSFVATNDLLVRFSRIKKK